MRMSTERNTENTKARRPAISCSCNHIQTFYDNDDRKQTERHSGNHSCILDINALAQTVPGIRAMAKTVLFIEYYLNIRLLHEIAQFLRIV